MYKKYIAEAIGTFALSLIIVASVASLTPVPMAVPLIASLTLGLFVYTIGPISGCHINPSVTLGLLFVHKISRVEAGRYIGAQLIGALCAIVLSKLFFVGYDAMVAPFESKVFFAEMLGAFFFNFGIAAVVYGKAKEQMSGLVVGGSLLFGILIATLLGASGILNPAVALALNAVTAVYLLAPVIGAVLGFQVYKYLIQEK